MLRKKSNAKDGNKKRENRERVRRKQFVHDFQEGDINTFAHRVLIPICPQDVHGEKNEREAMRKAGTGGMAELRIGRKRGESGNGRHGMEERRNIVRASKGRRKEERGKREERRNVKEIRVEGKMKGTAEIKGRQMIPMITEVE